MRYLVRINAERRFDWFSTAKLDLAMAERIAKDVAVHNHKKLIQVKPPMGMKIEAIMEDLEFQQNEGQIEGAGLPAIIVGFLVLTGVLIFGAAMWNWTVESVTKLERETNNLFSNPVFGAAVLAVVGYIGVEAFKRIMGK